MKNIDYYLKLPYRLEIVPDIYEGGFVASYPELPGCLTCAETIEEVIASALDAKKLGLKLHWKMVIQYKNLIVLITILSNSNFVCLRAYINNLQNNLKKKASV